MKAVKDITIKVSIDEANVLLRGLSVLPYADVFELITKIQQQAKPQLAEPVGAEEPEAEAASE